MSAHGHVSLAWIDARLDELLSAPPMWGSLEAVEMQALQLFDLRAHVLNPEQEAASPRRVLDTYMAWLRQRFPEAPPAPLFRLLGASDPRGDELGRTLTEFRAWLSSNLLEENPFEHSDVAIRLVFQESRAPVTSAFTGYYDAFRRAARAVARPEQRGARTPKGLWTATDFSLSDARVRQANGQPAEVLLCLGAGAASGESVGGSEVRDALTTLLTMAEWAASNTEMTDLPMDDVERRRRVAVQALRLLPRRGIEHVSIGGKLVGRPRPVDLVASHAQRLHRVIGAGTVPEPFDLRDEVRAIDLDRGELVLGKQTRIRCYAEMDLLGEGVVIGAQARVVGKRYQPLGARPFVLVEQIEGVEPIEDR